MNHPQIYESLCKRHRSLVYVQWPEMTDGDRTLRREEKDFKRCDSEMEKNNSQVCSQDRALTRTEPLKLTLLWGPCDAHHLQAIQPQDIRLAIFHQSSLVSCQHSRVKAASNFKLKSVKLFQLSPMTILKQFIFIILKIKSIWGDTV